MKIKILLLLGLAALLIACSDKGAPEPNAVIMKYEDYKINFLRSTPIGTKAIGETTKAAISKFVLKGVVSR
jgi:hypothetical protein